VGIIIGRQQSKTEVLMRLESMARVLVITGDGGESYEALYAIHRFREEGWEAVVAAPTRRMLHLVMHDFKPGWDT
jgi:protease I